MPDKTEELAPIIIKRKKVVAGDGHHGGAWKVAYADFVTAMMAFFLLMWLLNATTEEQRKGIADFFNPTIPMSRISGGGSDALNGSSVFTEETLARKGIGATREKSIERPDENGKASAAEAEAQEKAITKQLEALKAELREDSQLLSEQLLVRQSPDGIVIELIDTDDAALFEIGSSKPSPAMVALIEAITPSLFAFENDIKLVGHTDDRQFAEGRAYDNWDLSAERALTALRMMRAYGLPQDRVSEVSGKADSEPLIKSDPSAAQNRRISITILTR